MYNADGESNKQKPVQKGNEKQKLQLYNQNPTNPPENCLTVRLLRLSSRTYSHQTNDDESCPGGGIGRRAGFRCQWPQGRGSSSLLLGTIL